jgi:hypothetical protein
MIANLQYGWTLFVNPIEEKYHWGVPAIQVAFSEQIIDLPPLPARKRIGQ